MGSIYLHGSTESLSRIKNRAPRALVVDDDVESIQPLQTVLLNFGFETTLSFDGQTALEQIANKQFDIIFLDISMPGLTGLEVLEEVSRLQKHDENHFKREHPVPVVTYSSYDMDQFDLPDNEIFYFAGHWHKPITLPQLATLTGQAVSDLGLDKSKRNSRQKGGP